MYNNKVMEKFDDLKNVGLLRGANTTGTFEDEFGETVKIYMIIEDDKIVDAKFKAFGCIATIVVSDCIAEMVKGLSLKDAKNITDEQIKANFEEIKLDLTHCIEISKKAMINAIQMHEEKERKLLIKQLKEQGKPIPAQLKKSKVK